MSELIGFQEQMTWMGEEVLTLAEVWPEQPRAMIVGLNPAPRSVEAGHYYQGKSGQRQLLRLVSAGLLTTPNGSYFEESALAAGVGFTDIVRRPTTAESGVTKAEIAHGSNLLAESLAVRDVQLVICVFRHPVQALLGSSGTPRNPESAHLLGRAGVQNARTIPGSTLRGGDYEPVARGSLSASL